MMYAFLLGREFKLSIGEIQTIFPEGKIVFLNNQVLLLKNIAPKDILKKGKHLGGTIKIFEAQEVTENIDELILQQAQSEGKFKYGLSIFGEKKNLKELLLHIKKHLKSKDISSRYVNKDNENLSSAQIIGENLIKRESDFNYIFSDTCYFGKSIWVQDIAAYSKRDYDKNRDMQTGMLPPKLAQLMVNLSQGKTIYDPFVGLGTVLIESVFMGNTEVYGSDLNEKMIDISTTNIKKAFADNFINNGKVEVMNLNAKFIHESPYFKNGVDAIVTEGYLGEIMTKKNISIERIAKQKESLIKIYQAFFKELKNIKFQGNIVICFPFWEVKGKYHYFNDIYPILEKYCEILPLLKNTAEIETTKSGSLLYKRHQQLVGREIFKLKINTD